MDSPAAPAFSLTDARRRVEALLLAAIGDAESNEFDTLGFTAADTVRALTGALNDLDDLERSAHTAIAAPVAAPSDIELTTVELGRRVDELTDGERSRLAELLANLGLLTQWQAFDRARGAEATA